MTIKSHNTSRAWFQRTLEFFTHVAKDWVAPDTSFDPDDGYIIRKGYPAPCCVECGVEVHQPEEANIIDQTRPGDAERRIVRFGLVCNSCLNDPVRGKVGGSG